MKTFPILVGLIAGLVLAASASAKAPLHLVLDKAALSPSQCTPSGVGAKQVVDVTFTLTNYADSGYVGEWALDTVNRHLSIWRRSDGTYCARVADDGSTFVTLDAATPVGPGYLSPGIKGTFDGGYITTDILGKFKPTYATHGNLGTFDAKCDTNFNCPGKRPSWLSYFKNPKAEEFAQWGWLYDAGPHGSWLDQAEVSPPNGGNING